MERSARPSTARLYGRAVDLELVDLLAGDPQLPLVGVVWHRAAVRENESLAFDLLDRVFHLGEHLAAVPLTIGPRSLRPPMRHLSGAFRRTSASEMPVSRSLQLSTGAG